METIHPVEGSFGSELRAICNHCVVMAAWSRRRWNFVSNCCVFWKKTTPVQKVFIATGEWFWIDSNGKMETIHPVEGSFGSEFRAICNYCVVMAAWSRKTLKFCEQLLRFLEKRPLFRKFLSRHLSTLLCSNFMKFSRRETGEIVSELYVNSDCW